MFLSVDVANNIITFSSNSSLSRVLVKFVPYIACHSLVSDIAFCLVAIEFVMFVVVVVVAVQVMSVNFVLQSLGLLFCPYNVRIVVFFLYGVHLPVLTCSHRCTTRTC